MKIHNLTNLIIFISLLATGCQSPQIPITDQPNTPLPVPTLPTEKPTNQPSPNNSQSPSPVTSPVTIAPANIPTIQSPSPQPKQSSKPVEEKKTAQSTPTNQQVEGTLDPPTVCEINTVKVRDPNPPLNIRSAPNTTTGEILAKADNGQYLSVKGEQNGWLKIEYNYGESIEGWVAKNRTESSCNVKEQHITLPPAGGNIKISDRIIGGGSHKYTIDAVAGKTLTVTSDQGPLPFIFTPGDTNQKKDLTGGGDYTGKTNWSGELPVTGEYTLILDSNFRGYDYKLDIEVK
jgi:hypothetical protein